ncbi:MAG TPA: VWA domain-containing protein [Thermoanaerobaculia bacterium]|jgi:VWFA-related protein
MKSAVLGFALILSASRLLAQPAVPYIETYEVKIHNLDVVVTGRDGNPVTGLGQGDFVLLENGVEQTITNFSAVDASQTTSTAVVAGAAETPPAPPRRFIFFMDEMALHPASRAKLAKQAMAFATSTMKAGDQAMVVAPAMEQKIVQDFTTDRAALGAAIGKVMAASTSRTTQQMKELFYLNSQRRNAALGPAGTRTQAQEQRNIRQMYADMTRRRALQRLGELRSLISALGPVEGKKVLVLATTSLPAMPGLDAWADRRQEMFDAQEMPTSEFGELSDGTTDSIAGTREVYDLRPFIADLGRTAATNGVTIYALQPDVQLENLIGDNAAGPVSSFQAMLDMNETTMSSLAERTGGRWFRGDGNVDDVFQQVSKDLGAYYSLGYRAGADDDRVRKVEVRVKNHPELRVRTRSEVVNKSNVNEMQDLVVAGLLYPRTSNELGITASVGTMAKEPLGTILFPIDIRIPMEKLTFIPDGEKARAVFTVHYAAVGEKSDFTSAQERQQVIEIPIADLAKVPGKTWRYTTNLRFTPGKYRIAVGVFDRTTRLSGFQSLEVLAK